MKAVAWPLAAPAAGAGEGGLVPGAAGLPSWLQGSTTELVRLASPTGAPGTASGTGACAGAAHLLQAAS